MPTYFTQISTGFDIWSEILNVGGLIAVLLAFAVVVLWNKLTRAEDSLAALNVQMNKDARESIVVITSIEKLMDRLLDGQKSGHARIIEATKYEVEVVKALINEYKAQHNTPKS